MEITDLMDTDFVETAGRFSLNPSQITDIKYYENALYYYFNNSEYACMRIKFPNEEIARESLDNFKMCLARKSLGE
jgi:hypothetical protein